MHAETLLSELKDVLSTLLRSYLYRSDKRKETARKMQPHLTHLDGRKYKRSYDFGRISARGTGPENVL
jgi:hypothetical protein